MSEAENLAWDVLEGLERIDVCRRADVLYDRKTASFVVKMFSSDIIVSPQKRSISGLNKNSDLFIEKFHLLASLPILRYLIHAEEIPLSGNFINPSELPGGQIYTKGAHVLPLHLIEQKYGFDTEQFLAAGRMLGGELLNMGNYSLLLSPFPRIAVAIILWFNNEEFPARSILLLDSSCRQQLPLDIMWMIAMLCIMAMI
jgi:hypothetical protein